MLNIGSEPKPLDLIWGVKAISEEIGRTPRQTYHALTKGEIPARQVGNRWVVERGKLRAFFLGDAA